MERSVTVRGRASQVHASSLSFLGRCARAAMAASSAFRNETYWGRLDRGRVEAGTFGAIEHFLEPSGSFVDIGARVGAMSLFAARIARRCFALEPDPVANDGYVATRSPLGIAPPLSPAGGAST
jgi:hypothetical protein